jgi:mannose-6-phosphate isomerase-like protein (cupin superfamily)
MITRMWRGWTRPGEADAYERFLLDDLFPSMRTIDGFLGAEVLRRPEDDEVAFVTLTRFASLAAIRAFAGDAYERPVLEPRARELLSRHDDVAHHYETSGTLGIARLPAERDVVAPDGCDVRILLAASRGSMAHFQLGAGETSVAVRHRTIEELWYFVGGRGRMWRRSAEGEERLDDVETGISIDIPRGTAFQLRALGDEPIRAIGATMPPWPGPGEAIPTDGPWEPTVEPGPT